MVDENPTYIDIFFLSMQKNRNLKSWPLEVFGAEATPFQLPSYDLQR